MVIYGPPGAGKSTYAATLGLKMYDLDDWPGTGAEFKAAIAELATDPQAQAVVIRCNPYGGVAQQCAATDHMVIATPLDECARRIRARGRTKPSIRAQIAAAQTWWLEYKSHGRTLPVLPSGPRRRSL